MVKINLPIAVLKSETERYQVAVRQECYGAWVPHLRRGRCLCPIKGGALKRTDVRDLWVHMTCTWFQPKASLDSPLHRACHFYPKHTCGFHWKGLLDMKHMGHAQVLQMFHLLSCHLCIKRHISHGSVALFKEVWQRETDVILTVQITGKKGTSLLLTIIMGLGHRLLDVSN